MADLRATIAAVRVDGRHRDCRCPAHKDARASLSVGIGDGGRVLVKCHAGCAYPDILDAAGLDARDLAPARPEGTRRVTRYEIRDVDGTLIATHERIDEADGKRFTWRQPDGTAGLNGRKTAALPLYNTHRLREWAGQLIVITEGQAAADALTRRGIPAVGTVTGASGTPSDDSLRPLLAHPTVTIWPDADTPGAAHMARIIARLRALGHPDVRIVDWPDAPPAADAADYPADPREIITAARPVTSVSIVADLPADASLEIRITEEMARERARREARRRLAAEDRGKLPQPDIRTLRDRLTDPQPATTYRIHGWQPVDSRAMLTAQYKSGKTTLIGHLVRSLVDSDPFLDAATVAPITGSLALLDTEMSRWQLEQWLLAQHIRHDDRVIVVPLRGLVGTFDLLDPAVRAQWATWLRAHDVRYLILDCLRPLLDALGLDEHRDAGRLLVAFDALLAEAGIPEACVVHHMGHLNERARGDSRLRDWPDAEWRLVRRDDEPGSPRYITAYGRDVDVPEAALAWDDGRRRLTLVGGSRATAKVDAALCAVVEVLRDSDDPMTGRAIKAKLEDSDHGRNTIDAALSAGARSGRLVVTEGPRKSKLYRVSVPVSRECPGDFRDTQDRRVSECPAPYRGRDTGTLDPNAVDPSDPSVSRRDTQPTDTAPITEPIHIASWPASRRPTW